MMTNSFSTVGGHSFRPWSGILRVWFSMSHRVLVKAAFLENDAATTAAKGEKVKIERTHDDQQPKIPTRGNIKNKIRPSEDFRKV